jgi:transcriptional regulator with XRE-family HTH domain
MDYKKLGSTIAAKREVLGLSQTALARQVGIDRSHVSHIENGTKVASAETLKRIAVALGLSAEDVLGVNMTQREHDMFEAATVLERKLREYLTPEQLDDICVSYRAAQNAEGAVLQAGNAPMAAGPDGWTELTKEDRRLVQTMVNRLKG